MVRGPAPRGGRPRVRNRGGRLSSTPLTSFADLGLEPDLLSALADVGYEAPSPIQEQPIPPLLAALDAIRQAQPGSGKTAAFGLPMLQYADADDGDVQGLVLTPTRELGSL